MNRFFHFAIAASLGIARDQPHRRRAMFALTLAALLMLFAGTFLLWDSFALHPLFFAIYWLVCLWLVICTILLAICDLLIVITLGRDERSRARKDVFRKID